MELDYTVALTNEGVISCPNGKISHQGLLALMYGHPKEFNMHELIENLNIGPGDVFVDLGSNVGQELIPLSDNGVVVHGFEPHPLLFSFLEKKCSHRKNIILNRAAAATKKGVQDFFYKNDIMLINGGATLDPEKAVTRANSLDLNCAYVETVDIAEYIDKIDDKISVLKIDTEGTEYDILDHLLNRGTLKKIDTILLEDHGHNYQTHSTWFSRAASVLARLKASPYLTNIILWNGAGVNAVDNDHATNALLDESQLFLESILEDEEKRRDWFLEEHQRQKKLERLKYRYE